MAKKGNARVKPIGPIGRASLELRIAFELRVAKAEIGEAAPLF
jgi:hypothetical protein